MGGGVRCWGEGGEVFEETERDPSEQEVEIKVISSRTLLDPLSYRDIVKD